MKETTEEVYTIITTQADLASIPSGVPDVLETDKETPKKKKKS